MARQIFRPANTFSERHALRLIQPVEREQGRAGLADPWRLELGPISQDDHRIRELARLLDVNSSNL